MSRSGRSLNTHQVRALAALLEGQPVHLAAQLAGVSSRQVYRYLRDDRFTGRLNEEQDALVLAVGVKLLSLAEKALAALEEVMDFPERRGANVKRLAGVSVLDLLLKYRDQVSLEARVSALEDIVGEKS